jgi:vacuolar protein sorting-associated protein 35
VSRLLHQLGAEDPQQHFAILCAVRGHLERGGPRRARHTFPALAFCGLEVGGAQPGPRGALSRGGARGRASRTRLGASLCVHAS